MTTSGFTNEAGRDQISSGRRILAVLETLAARPGGMTPKEVSQALQIHLSTCYRLLNTLQEAGYAVRSANGHFALGRRVGYLNHRYLASVRPSTEVRAFLRALQLATGETVMLLRLEGHEVVIIEAVEGSRPAAHPGEYAGLSGPAYAFAAGRVLLANLPAAQCEAAITRCQVAPALPWLPSCDQRALRDDLSRIKQAGYAVDRGVGGQGVCCLAAPTRLGEGEPAAVAILAPCSRFVIDESRMLPVLLEVARSVSALNALPAREASWQTGDNVAQAAIEAAQAAVADAMSRVRETSRSDL
jgi:DNA-binding IclR family transcriptional regulator